jgi:hypothetical protein
MRFYGMKETVTLIEEGIHPGPAVNLAGVRLLCNLHLR